MKLRRRDFARGGIGALAALLARPVWTYAAAEEEAPPTRPLLAWGSNGHADGQFDIPIAIVVNRKDEVLVTDFRQTNAESRGRLQRFAADGRFLASCEIDPMPGGLALDQEGLLFATHMMQHKVAVYDPAGKKIREFGKQGTAPGEFQQPGGIAFGPDGSIYVADQVNRRVQRLTPHGEPISAWGKYGTQTGEFGGIGSPASRTGGPQFLAFNRQGELYTTEGLVGRVQKFKSDGTFLLAWGDNEVGPGHFGGHKGLPGPIAVAIDAADNVWVSSTNHYVQQFAADGRFLRRWGGEGAEPGQFKLPHGLAFDSQNHLYVADSRNSRIQKFAI